MVDPNAITVTSVVAHGWFAPLQVQRSYILTAPTGSVPGVATVTVDLHDPDATPNHTTTSFVLQTIGNSDAAPSFGTSSDGTFLVCPVPTPNPTPFQYHYKVISNDSTPLDQLRVTPKSSNTKLISNDSTHLFCSNPDSTGAGTVTLIPNLPLPTPSPGVPQSSTITLTVTDGSYQRQSSPSGQSSFLYVVSDATSPAIAFARPAGVYLLDPSQGDHRTKTFLTGETLAVSWAQVEMTEGMYVWTPLNTAIDAIDQTQDISLNIQEEPCYIAKDMNHQLEFLTWCDDRTNQPLHLVDCSTTNSCGTGGTARPVPWDSRLQTQRDAFYQQLATFLTNKGVMSRVSTINPNLPGGNNGIRDVSLTQEWNNLDGYTRQRLLQTIQDELRTLQFYFPGKLIQIGFFTTKDTDHIKELWQWLFHDASTDTDPLTGVHLVALGDEFNGIMNPRVSFFQENLAATRILTANGLFDSSSAPNYITPASTTPYTFSPLSSIVPSFAYYATPTNDQYRNGNTWQSNTPWSNPFGATDGIKLTRTINGSPNDGMEAAFSNYLSQYLEIYPDDVDEADPAPPATVTLNAELWKGQLQSWKDYAQARRNLAPIEGPAGLNIERTNSTSNFVTWFPVFGAATYAMQRAALIGSPPTWTDVTCADATATQCLDTSMTMSEYAYRVRANGAGGAPVSTWSYVAMFLSESALDGYVEKKNTTFTVFNNNTTQPGIKAGEGSGNPLPHWKGFASFKTGQLGSTATVLSAKLRLNQFTDGTHFGTPTQCMVDIKKGSFNNMSTLEKLDWDASPTTATAFKVTNANLNGWFGYELTPAVSLASVGTGSLDPDNHTQFRIYFPDGTMANRNEGWYSGESSSNNARPQLIVRYNQ